MANLLDALVTIALGLVALAAGSAAEGGGLGICDVGGGMLLRTGGLEFFTGVDGA